MIKVLIIGSTGDIGSYVVKDHKQYFVQSN